MKSIEDFMNFYNRKKPKSGAFSDYTFLPIIQDNSPYEHSLFNTFKGKDLDIKPLLTYLDAFFEIYAQNFSGNEREPVSGILRRILPKKYHNSEYINNITFEKVYKVVYEKKYPNIEDNILLKEINEGYIESSIKSEGSFIKTEEQNNKNDQTILLICFNKEKEVEAGMILEFYAKRDNGKSDKDFDPVSYVILTYIFIKDGNQRQRTIPKGLGTYLIKNKLPILINNEIFYNENDDEKKPQKPQYVFFEVDNPQYVETTRFVNRDDVDFTQSEEEYKCIRRLNFFNKVGARWLDIAYVQPKLDKDLSRVYNLFFMVLPHVSKGLNDNPFTMNKYHILDFLISFYNTNEGDKGITFEDFYLQDNKIENIFEKDTDLARSWLAIEIADALDDLESQGDEFTKKKIKEIGSEYNQENPKNYHQENPQNSQYRNLIKRLKHFKKNIGNQKKNKKIGSESNQENSKIYQYRDLLKQLKDLQKKIENQFDFIADELLQLNEDEKYSFSKRVNDTAKLKHEPSLSLSDTDIQLKQKIDNLKESECFDSLQFIKEELGKIKVDNAFDNNVFYLKEVPKFTLPRLLFDRASVAFHIALKPNLRPENISFINNEITYEYDKEDNIDERKREDEGKREDERKILLIRQKNTNSNSEKVFTKVIPFDNIVCPIFGSYENDLLAYNYYSEKTPIKSKRLGTFNLKITFPYKVEFLSEGRKETLFINAKPDRYAKAVDETEYRYFSYTKEVKCFLNLMYFKPDEFKELQEKYDRIVETIINNDTKLEKDYEKVIIEYELLMAKNIVWELIFTNDTDDKDNTKRVFTDFEIIQLSKFFSGKQEKNTIQLKFKPPDDFENKSTPKVERKNKTQEEEYIKDNINKIVDILNYLVEGKPSIYDVHAGTIQIDTLNTKILPQKGIVDKTREAIEYVYEQLFLEDDSENIDDNSRLKHPPQYKNINVRIETLLEEYLKDNVDNIDLQKAIYLKQKAKTEQISNLEIYRNAKEFHYDDSFTGFEDSYNENEFLKYFFDSLCGISLGIFDFGRMGYEEVTDTIAPLYESATDKAMIVMKRGSVFSACHNNSVYESSISTIGISPYLIIPNSVLVYNRLHAEQNKKLIDDIFKLTKEEENDKEFLKIRANAKKTLKVNNNDLYQILIHLRKRTETYLDKINIPNIFNYTTEQEIYKIGMEERGINENINEIKETKHELDESIKDLVDIRQTIFSLLITIFLGIISFIGFWDPIVNHIDIEWEGFYIANGFLSGQYTFNLGAIIFNILFLSFILYFGTRLKNILPKYITIDWKRKIITKILWIIVVLTLLYAVKYILNLL